MLAKKRNNNSIINFSVQDATKLDFGNELFGQIIYLQQIISTIEEPGMRLSALEESYRVLEKGGTAIFSFLSFESKKNDSVFKIISPVIKFFRFIKSKKISEQYIPWLKFSGKVNFKALFDIGPYNYWFRRQEIIELLESVGYKIEFYGYPKKILFNNSSTKSAFGKSTEEVGHFYVVCKKVL
ncbi:MAG: class I SAM-dependent methyltransferase [Ignavibacterium sp.]|nr:class I SAM-dependent methyltransferase [Ignavibacterium sp.]